jgi:hypothetical protein
MSKYIKKTIAEYEHNMKKTLLEHPTPAAPGTILSKLDEKETADCVDQFRKYIGRVLYAVLKVLLDCANVIRDLTGHMTTSGKEHWKALEHLLGYLKNHNRPMKFVHPRSCKQWLCLMEIGQQTRMTERVFQATLLLSVVRLLLPGNPRSNKQLP